MRNQDMADTGSYLVPVLLYASLGPLRERLQ
jgi:hypothetical protein